MFLHHFFLFIDNLPGPLYPGQGQGQGQYHPESRNQKMGPRSAPTGIHTVKEDPDMPDSQVIVSSIVIKFSMHSKKCRDVFMPPY